MLAAIMLSVKREGRTTTLKVASASVMLCATVNDVITFTNERSVAVENLLRKRTMDRWKLTFLFGLVHGFGFSNVLREMQLPRANLALSLFSFNLGVEIGQIVFVVLLFPAIEDLIKSGWTWLRPAVSIAIGLLAAYWFIQRAFFG